MTSNTQNNNLSPGSSVSNQKRNASGPVVGTGGTPRLSWREQATKAFEEEHTTEGRIRFPKRSNPHDD